MSNLPPVAVLLSFEGPDPYSMVGGLGTRVTELSAALAEAGVRTTLVFVGDPARPPVERPSMTLEYRRWCQWISADYPAGVYDGELAKMADYTASVPSFVLQSIVEPAATRGESVLVIAEDWQTAPAILELDALLRQSGMRERVALTWNANNTYGFHTIDWTALAAAARITTVSRYMKFELQKMGAQALVIPNGIPERSIRGAPKKLVKLALRALGERRPFFVKVARFEEDKRWMQAIEAFAGIARRYPDATLVVRGGREAYGTAVLDRARELGLSVADFSIASRDPEDVLEALCETPAAIINVRSFLPEEALLVLYHVADAVLANSGREPFGLVGLEVMAVGGVPVTGSTGEDYVQPFDNALVCDTGEAGELAALLDQLIEDHEWAMEMAAEGEATARRYVWPKVLEILARKLDFVLAGTPPAAVASTDPPPHPKLTALPGGR